MCRLHRSSVWHITPWWLQTVRNESGAHPLPESVLSAPGSGSHRGLAARSGGPDGGGGAYGGLRGGPAGLPRRAAEGGPLDATRPSRWPSGGCSSTDCAARRRGRRPFGHVAAVPCLLVATTCVAFWHRAKSVHWVMDLYPEIAVALGEIRPEGWLASCSCRRLWAGPIGAPPRWWCWTKTWPGALRGYGVRPEVIRPVGFRPRSLEEAQLASDRRTRIAMDLALFWKPGSGPRMGNLAGRPSDSGATRGRDTARSFRAAGRRGPAAEAQRPPSSVTLKRLRLEGSIRR